MPNYALWPLTTDLDLKLANIGVTLRASVTTAYKQQILDAVTQEVTLRTRREFIATGTGVQRQFDGSGTPELEIDEFIASSVTACELLAESGSVALTFNTVKEMEERIIPRSRIILFRGTIPLATMPILTNFPQGRRNIRVTAQWGYAASIPQDLWDAVAGEAAARLAMEATFETGYDSATGANFGRLRAFTEADAHEEYQWVTLDDGTRWTRAFARAIREYRRPSGKHLRRLRAPMI